MTRWGLRPSVPAQANRGRAHPPNSSWQGHLTLYLRADKQEEQSHSVPGVHLALAERRRASYGRDLRPGSKATPPSGDPSSSSMGGVAEINSKEDT